MAETHASLPTVTALRARLAQLWRPRRRLRATRAGRALIAMTLVVGFAAFNTGNNLLFFGWGLLLSSIVVSGILSEATLRAVTASPGKPGELRAREMGKIPLRARNTRRVPAFAVEWRAALEGSPSLGLGPGAMPRAFELRLAPGAARLVELAFTPARRGLVRVPSVRARTAFPFGFFEKEKQLALEPPLELVVLPARVLLHADTGSFLARLGESPARRAGPGDELFSLRPFRAGDDLRRVAWRRAARTHRLVVRETEAARSQDVIVEVVASAITRDDAAERAVEVAAALVEKLLERGHAVGLLGPGVSLPAAHGARQRSALLTQLALLDPRSEPAAAPGGRAVILAVMAEGSTRPAHATAAVRADSAVRGGHGQPSGSGREVQRFEEPQA